MAGEREATVLGTETVIGADSLVREARGEEEEERSEMAPWEQHSAVISIPRFDYKAPSSLLEHSRSGFLVTCPIKREKSATKEAMFLLEKFIRSFNDSSSESSEISVKNDDLKRRKICKSDINGECTNSEESKGKCSEDSCFTSTKSDTKIGTSPVLSLVKLTRSGLLLFTFPTNHSPDVVAIVSNIIHSLESGGLSSPHWCHRICPIQATCSLNEKELHKIVSNLVIQFMNDKRNKIVQPIKFAVGYNRRGIEETEMKTSKSISGDSDPPALLDRNKCFSIVAAAVKDIASDAVVDLKSPELTILVELLPLSGVPNRSLVVGISVLPHKLVNTKPRLCVKALVPDIRAKNGRKNH